MHWWLSVFFFVNGVWVPGDQVDGWSARAYATEEDCIEHKAFAERECRDHPLTHEAVWVCNYGEPARTAPAKRPSIEC